MIPLRSTVIIGTIGALTAAGGVALAQDDESSKEPAAIIADATRDLAKVKSYHLAGTIVDEDGRTTLSADVFASGDGRLVLSNKNEKAQLIARAGKAYIKANRAYWRDVSGKGKRADKVVRAFTGRWIILDESDKSAASLLEEFTPKRLAACLRGGVGTLSKAGTATVAGQPAVVLKDAGDKPGTTAGSYYFTSKAPVLPLRATSSGKAKPGKTKDKACSSDTGNASDRSDIAFSRFGKVAKVTPPRGALTIEQAVRGGSDDGGTTPA
jgi:hypothetical protein